MLQRLATWFFWGYTLMLLGIGSSGMLIAPWELRTIFAVPLDAFSPLAQATLLNQYRFLKAMELAFGLYCLFWRGAIHHPGPANRLFLAGVAAGVAARLGSWLVDGTPHPIFLGFAAGEAITGVLVAWRVRRRPSA
jgi:hypothetical protein